MKKIIVGTTNPAKVSQIRDALSSLNIIVEGAVDKKLLPEVVEDGLNVQENARKKALTYSRALNSVVLSMDNALFLDGLDDTEQPGIHVRRIGGGFAATDEELLNHATCLVRKLGGRVTGRWEYGICISSPEGKIFETHLVTERIFTDTPSSKIIQGYPLESIQIDPKTGKYISEMSKEQQSVFWQETLGYDLCQFVKKYLSML